MSQLTQNLGLEIFDVENLDDQKKVKDYLKGVAGISGSNMIKIDEAFGNISSSNVYPRYTALVNELDNKFYLYKDDLVTAVTNFASLPEKFVLQIQCTSTKAFNGESIFTVNDSFDPVIKNKDSFLRDDFGWPVFEKGSDKSFLVEKYIDNTGAEPDNFVFIAALADVNFESRAIRYYDVQDKLGLGTDANVNEAILKLNDKIETVKTNKLMNVFVSQANTDFISILDTNNNKIVDLNLLPDEFHLLITNLLLIPGSPSYTRFKVGEIYLDWGSKVEDAVGPVILFSPNSVYLLHLKKVKEGEIYYLSLVSRSDYILNAESIMVDDDNLTEKLNDFQSKIDTVQTDVTNIKSDLDYLPATIVSRQIRVPKVGNLPVTRFKISSPITTGTQITVSTDGGATSRPLKDIEGTDILELKIGFYEVIADATFFTLRASGSLKINEQDILEGILTGNVDEFEACYAEFFPSSGADMSNPIKLANPSQLPTNTGSSTAFSSDGVYLSVAHTDFPFITIYKRSGDIFTKLANPSLLPPSTGRGTAFSPDGVYLSVAHSAFPFVTIYKRNGDEFTKLANPSQLPPDIGYGTAFSPDGVYLSVVHFVSPFITIYKRSGDIFTKLANPSQLPTNTGFGTAFSPDGIYLSVVHSTSPFVTIYKRSGDEFTKLANPSLLPSGTGYGAAFSPDGVYLSVVHFVSPFITIYKRSGDIFTKPINPSQLPTNTGNDTAFSSDGVYLSIAHNSSPFVTIHKRSGDVFTKLADPSTLPTGTGNGTAFSPDGIYLSVAHDSSPFVTIYKRSGDIFTKLANPSQLPTSVGRGTAFSPDSVYLSVAHTDSPFITIYKRSGDIFTKLANPSQLPTGIGYGTAFSPDGVYLSVAHTTSPFITIYKRSGDVFTKLSNPSQLPTGGGYDTAFSPDGIYLSVAHDSSPFITIYKRNGDVFTKLADPSQLPTGTGRGITFSPDGVYLSVACSTSPFVTIYKRSGDIFTKLADQFQLLPGMGRSTAFSPDGVYLSVAHVASPFITIYKGEAYPERIEITPATDIILLSDKFGAGFTNQAGTTGQTIKMTRIFR